MKFIESLMEFQRRVLFQARADSIKDKLFFTNIFMSNTNEMFQKYDMTPVMNNYIDMVGECIHNYEQVLSGLNEKEEICIDKEDSFESRHNSIFKIKPLIQTRYLQLESAYSTVSNLFKDDTVYYVSLLENSTVEINFIDPKASVYSEPFNMENKGVTTYWPTLSTILSNISVIDGNDVIAFKVTHSVKVFEDEINKTKFRLITKVEYSSNTETMSKLATLFGNDALIIRNPFLYTKDLEYICNKAFPTNIETQIYRPIEALDIMNDDMIIEYPSDTFDDYLQFLKSAVSNPETKSIYMTIYRIGKDPSIYYILREAVRKGIEVTVNIELQARGDEVDNVIWMKEFQDVGINVLTYQCFKMKIHCKLTLVEFNNGKSVAQIGTGNYHTKTSSQYTDLNLITSDDKICNNIKKTFTKLFKYKPVCFNSDLFLITQFNFKMSFKQLVEEQTRLKSNGYICIKCNTLSNAFIEQCLQKAADEGVKIDLIIRGACTWCPPQLGSTVKIKSIVWDKLEHSRVMCFGSDNPKIYIGSLDLVTSKIEKRIETMVKITSPYIIVQMINYLNRYITTTKGSWVMQSDGTYRKEIQ